MTQIVVDQRTVARCLPMSDCIDLMAETQISLSRKEAQVPQRAIQPVGSNGGAFCVMPGETRIPAVFGAKLISVFPRNTAIGEAAIRGGILLFEPDHGAPIALVDASAVTAIRTAAASGMATRALADENASVLGLLGCGVQAVTHLEAMLAVRPVEKVRVWGRSIAKAEAFAQAQGERYELSIEAVADAEDAVRGADLLCTVTGSHQPVLQGAWISPGCHLNLVGAHTPTSREVDTEAIRRSRVYVEVIEFALNEAGDLIIPIEAGDISETHIVGEIGAVVSGELPGRDGPEEITLYKSLGNTAQDLAAAHHVYQQARAAGLGETVAF